MIHTLKKTQIVPIDLKTAWDFFSSPKNLDKLTPKDLGLKIKSEVADKMYPGMLITYDVNPLPFMKSTWVTEITHVDEPNYFVDEQRLGPYSFWHHKHYFKEVAEGVEVADVVDYALPLGLLGDLLNHLVVKQKLEHIFNYRSKVLKDIFKEK